MLSTRQMALSDRQMNGLFPEDRAVHRWYRFVLAFPPHLVREYIARFQLDGSRQVLDPFCGTGTTLVECKKLGVPSIGVEANPVVSFASRVKTDWDPDPDGLLGHAKQVASHAYGLLKDDGIEDIPLALHAWKGLSVLRALPPEKTKLLLANSISPLPLHKTLVLLDSLGRLYDARYYAHERLALANVVVHSASNLHFGPEVGVGTIKADEAVVDPWLAEMRAMVCDLREVGRSGPAPARVYPVDARELVRVLEPGSVDAVITSPPYPNEKDYTRTTRLESVLLGFIESRSDLQALKRSLVRSNTRGVYVDDEDDQWVAHFPRIQQLARDIESRRIELGKTSGFERLYARVTRLCFGGMARHFSELRRILRPGAQLAYVVGDQASYLRVLIRTSEILAEVAESLGYKVTGTDLFRTRFATATQQHIREDVLLLRWPGGRGDSSSE
jgi:DNA modification methylase